MNGKLETIVRGAARIMLDNEKAPAHRKPGHNNFVTDADVMVQEYLHGKLQAFLPGSVFFSEEQDNSALTDAPTWVVDPIDGTFNFIKDRKCSAISVALLSDRRPILGVIFNPYSNEFFRAENGHGATLNSHPIKPSDTTFDIALVNFGTSPYQPELSRQGMNAALEFLTHAGDLRRSGSAALEMCEIAAGRADVFFEMSLSPWDYAAASLIVKESGAHFAMPLENNEDFGRPACVLACNNKCLEQSLQIIRAAAGRE